MPLGMKTSRPFQVVSRMIPPSILRYSPPCNRPYCHTPFFFISPHTPVLVFSFETPLYVTCLAPFVTWGIATNRLHLVLGLGCFTTPHSTVQIQINFHPTYPPPTTNLHPRQLNSKLFAHYCLSKPLDHSLLHPYLIPIAIFFHQSKP